MLKRLITFSLLIGPILSDPYYGGTLLSTIPENIPPGTWYIEPYLYITHQFGTYNSEWDHSSKPKFNYTLLQWEFETGITPWLDIALYPNFYYTDSSFKVGDTQLALGFQILQEEKNRPAIRFIIQESFPTGKYDHLRSLSAATGTGSYQTWLSTVFYKTLTPFTLNLTLNYILSSHVKTRGLNIYTLSTHSKFRPGDQLIVNLGIEYSLSKHTIFGLDLHYEHQNSSASPSLEQFSLAPCIEYNPTPNLSFESGPWFTIAGRNTSIFISGVLTMYWQF